MYKSPYWTRCRFFNLSCDICVQIKLNYAINYKINYFKLTGKHCGVVEIRKRKSII